MDAGKTQLITFLKDRSYSVTHARLAVFDMLAMHSALTINELGELIPEINRTSIYRVVELYEKIGVVQRVYIGWKYSIELSELFQPHHHHATCTVCGKHVALPESNSLEKELEALSAANTFAMQSHLIEILGICSNCQSKTT